MKSILKLMQAHIRRGKDAFLGILLLMSLITFSFSGTVSNDDVLRNELEKNFAEENVGDLVVMMYDDNLTEDMLSSLDSNTKVAGYSVKKLMYLKSLPVVDGHEEEVVLNFRRWNEDINIFNDSSDGFTEDNELKQGEILLPYKLKMNKRMKPGAEISFTTSSGRIEKYTVKGFYEDKVFGATTVTDSYCVLPEEDYDRLAAEELDHTDSPRRLLLMAAEIHIYAADCVTAADLSRDLTDGPLIRSANAVSSRQHLMELFEMYSNTGTRGMAVFTLILLTAILITMHNSISASVEMEYTDLGILRALGFSVSRIRLIYVAEYVLALVAGSILGIIVSIPVCAVLIRKWMNITCILTDTGVSLFKCAVMAIAMILICIGFIFIATSKVSHISPVRAISGGRSEVYFDSRLNSRIRKHPFSLSLVLGQLNTHRRSYAGTAFIVAILVYFLVSITLLTANLDPDKLFSTTKGEINILNTGGLTISNADEIEDAVREMDSGASLYTKSSHRMIVDWEFVFVDSFRRTEDQYDIIDGRQPKFDNEIMLTKNLADDLGKTIGDTVTVTYMDKKDEYIVTGYFQTIFEFGNVSMMTSESMTKLGYNDIREAQVSLSDTSKKDEITDMLNSRFADRLSASENKESATMLTYKKIVNVLMNSSIYTMYIVILIFAAVVVVMLCRRSFIRERTDIGIFKALGMSAGSLRNQFALRFAAVALIGSVVGGAASAFLARKMIAFMLKIVGLTDIKAAVSPMTFALPAAAVCICFFAFAYIVSGKIKSVDVRELITE